ncbi:Pnap_2097 family protein [Rhizobium sp. WYJ-E13]|uniref:Pnap_2097 family protein n=1 Tax=Rhizobium sp. WYJ-E13 TaxID=2849093 RepID=UPI001C1F06CB|nr:Pnap_2097 family protein [Rhizobium sp. WYJ-E13]QWW70202.1 DNA gyrase [Rhizobium sp. WYJ-E13]
MNVAILDFHSSKLSVAEPSARELMDQALAPHVLIGMPHLTPAGLSETWAMKELGHRHWLMLARHLGMENADFRTPDGGEAYAAICATSLEHANFDAVRANDVLTIRSALSPVSRTQVSTRHRLFVRGNLIGEVELISTFVCRMREGDNYSIARVPLPGLTAAAEDNALARTAALLRAGTLETHFGLPANPTKALRGFRFEPDASQEFNGAGLFYFAEFQALTDRAFGRWFPEISQITRREIFFSGNIRAGEAVRVEMMGLSPDRYRAHCRLRREDDGKVIGKAFMEWRSS